MNIYLDRPKKRQEEAVERVKPMRGLKRTDAQDRSLWRLGCKNRFTPARGENNPGLKRMKDLSALPKQMDDDDMNI